MFINAVIDVSEFLLIWVLASESRYKGSMRSLLVDEERIRPSECLQH